MAKNNPVIIWIIKHTPNNEPKFHHAEILEGVGKSIKEELKILNKEWVLRIFIIFFYPNCTFFFFT